MRLSAANFLIFFRKIKNFSEIFSKFCPKIWNIVEFCDFQSQKSQFGGRRPHFCAFGAISTYATKGRKLAILRIAKIVHSGPQGRELAIFDRNQYIAALRAALMRPSATNLYSFAVLGPQNWARNFEIFSNFRNFSRPNFRKCPKIWNIVEFCDFQSQKLHFAASGRIFAPMAQLVHKRP